MSDAQRILAEAYADCGCGIPSPFDEVAEHAVTIAEAKGFERGKAFSTPTTPASVADEARNWTIERDSNGEAMVCTGCGTTRTLDHIRYISPNAFSCCPERKMIPVRDALAFAARPAGEGGREAGRRWVIGEARKTLRLVQGCLECNADDERRWSETIEWLERLA